MAKLKLLSAFVKKPRVLNAPTACPANCIKPDQCDNEREKGLWVDVKYFQIGAIDIPSDVSERYLKTLTLKEDNAREKFLQDASVVRKGTQQRV